MTKTKRSTLMAVLILLLCVAMVAAGTYALFTDEVKLTNHLKAGTLDITLERTNLSKWYIDKATGLFVEGGSNVTEDFSDPKNKNIFGIAESEVIVPKSIYTAEMRITNNSDVAFHYWLEIVFDDTEDLALADQLYVTVVTVDGKVEAKLSELTSFIGSEKEPISTVLTTKDKNFESFTVTVEFLDLGDANNDAKSQSIDFDLLVHAVQVTPPETTP